MSAPKLFSPGPVLVKANVRNALLHYDICHRSKEFEEMFVDTQNKIIKLFKNNLLTNVNALITDKSSIWSSNKLTNLILCLAAK